MRAAILEAFNEPLVIRDVALAEPGPHEVVVRTAAVGLCHSDLHFMTGDRKIPLPGVLGHEVAGVIEQIGPDVPGLKVGDHVVGTLTAYCGHCPSCVVGNQVNCSDTDVRHLPGTTNRLSDSRGKVSQVYNLSGFAEKMLVHYSCLVPITKDMPLDRAALLGCATLTGTGAVFRSAKVEPGSTVAVIGCGGIGLSTINGAKIAGAGRIIAIDLSDKKLDMAMQFGATDRINATSTDPVEAVRELTRGGVAYSFECIGLPAAATQAFAMLAANGTATILGVFPVGAEITLPTDGLLQQKRLQGSFLGSARLPVDIPRLVDHYLAGRLYLDEMVSQRITLDQINDGFDDMKKGNVARSVIVFPGVGV